ncbi:glycosyltransferase family 4 protein [Pseudoxanthomonas wuyuanensis]|uniref:Glycosyltransferase involved in cell wall bisynthesis n=1 Tax=Pseudoxanthomonas wuyuanensis TaxID=1073196 RepID=A0A286CV94_9GAMM|nr:glycosyltransferase family 1 protein [Pseudoxanthomonas wuyuanensis]KAF1717344.1 glycosyltransferase family 1 protein [Pseudoxanthomonas wuyuanensis]SOD50265.1 Glycosyltransferase involved in cell wall bisynthesis [Pseudoxanthomonas wuyuanensis]
MRYAIVTETYPPEVNGVALTVQGLEQGLRNRGHLVSVVRPRQDGDAAPNGDLLVRGASLPRYPGLKFGLPATRKLMQLWKESTPDAIYVATEGPLGWSALRAARRCGIPAATGFHTRFDEYMRDYGAAFLQKSALRWMRRFHNSAQATLVPTRELAEFLQSHGFERVVRLARAVDIGQFGPGRRDDALRSQWGLGQDGLAAIYVGRIAAEKNLLLAVAAFRELQRSRPDARFIWVGDGPMRESLARANPDFIFCGVQRGDDLARHFASGDLFLFPSHSETFGNVTLEAMASGVATVAFNYGAAREHLRDGAHGAAVDSDAGFIAATVELGRQDALRQAMGAAACASVQSLQPEQVAADFDELLSGLVDTRNRHAPAAVA